MKYSTYIMLAAFCAGLVAVVVLALTLLASAEPWENSAMKLKGKSVSLTLPEFCHIDISIYSRGEKFILENFRGIEIVECDSIDAPAMSLSESINAMTETRMVGDTLYLSVDPSIVCDTINPKNMMFLEAADIHPIKVTVPAGMLKSIRNSSDAVYLSNFNARRIDASVKKAGRIVINNCTLDSLVSDSRHIAEIKLTDSKIAMVQLDNAPEDVSIKCTDATSAISKLRVAAKKSDTESALSLKKATVGKIEWIPLDSTTVLDLQLASPVTIISESGN